MYRLDIHILIILCKKLYKYVQTDFEVPVYDEEIQILTIHADADAMQTSILF